MSWIAKNDLTGKTYGKSFNSIYDCLDFINTYLINLQFAYSLVCGLEKDFDTEESFKDFYSSKYNNHSFPLEICARIEFATKSLFNGVPPSRRNNVIRCWNTTQKRWAESMDF